MHARYSRLAKPEQLVAFREQYAEMVQAEARRRPGASAAALWLEAETIFDRLGRPEPALQCVQGAIQSNPGDVRARFRLARRLMATGQYADAESQIRWSVLREPGNREYQP